MLVGSGQTCQLYSAHRRKSVIIQWLIAQSSATVSCESEFISPFAVGVCEWRREIYVSWKGGSARDPVARDHAHVIAEVADCSPNFHGTRRAKRRKYEYSGHSLYIRVTTTSMQHHRASTLLVTVGTRDTSHRCSSVTGVKRSLMFLSERDMRGECFGTGVSAREGRHHLTESNHL